MGLFDSILKQAGDALAGNAGDVGGGQGNLMQLVIGLINNPQTGGLPGLINTLQQAGLGDVIASWISTGKNLPISGDQLQAALGNEQMQTIGQQLGMSAGDASNSLANLLPQVIDQLTPNGQLPNNDLLEKGLAMLKGFGSRA